jgi:hypothetical protein
MMYREHVVSIHGRGNTARGIDVPDLEVFLIVRWRQVLLGKLPQAQCVQQPSQVTWLVEVGGHIISISVYVEYW